MMTFKLFGFLISDNFYHMYLRSPSAGVQGKQKNKKTKQSHQINTEKTEAANLVLYIN